jgi:regulator of RNase E activity RraA
VTDAALSAGELEELRGYSTPTICNAIETFGVRGRHEGFMDSSIACRFPELGRMVGYAVTARIRASAPAESEVRHDAVWREFARVPKPWAVVIEDLDPAPIGSYWGEVNASVYRALGAVGVVTNGGVRDLAEVRALGFHFFSSCVLVSHAYVHVVDVGTAVRVGGLEVRPGDMLHGDEHGVTSVPPRIAGKVAEAAAAIESGERPLIEYAQSEACTVEGLVKMYGHVD